MNENFNNCSKLNSTIVINIGCTQGDVRLQNGQSVNEGRLEVCINDTWGTVCDDTFQDVHAQVVCRQLGYSVDGARSISAADGNGIIWLDEVMCLGNETELLDCPSNPIGINDCDSSDDVGVRCVGM